MALNWRRNWHEGGRSNRRGNVIRPWLEALEDRFLMSVTLTASANVNISRELGDQTEATIALDPKNSQQLFSAANEENAATAPAIFSAFSVNGGRSWTTKEIVTSAFGIGNAISDPQAVFDQSGNLFLTFLVIGPNATSSAINPAPVILLSTDGGQNFRLLQEFTSTFDADQPSIAVGAGSIWITYNRGVSASADAVQVSGASVAGLNSVGAFSAPTSLPGSGGGNFGDIAVGPNGQVIVTYQVGGTLDSAGTSVDGPSNIEVNVNPTGLGGTFGAAITATVAQVGPDDTHIAATTNNFGIDAEANLGWDTSTGTHRGRVYLLYTDAPAPTSAATTIEARFSDDNGQTWSAPVKVNSDSTSNSHFYPSINVDPVTGDVGVQWYDCRNDPANTSAQLWAGVSTDGGATYTNIQVSAGTSNSADSQPPVPTPLGPPRQVGYGDYMKTTAFFNGVFHCVWTDNSNSTGDNPNGTLSKLDVYTAAVTVGAKPPVTTVPTFAVGADAGGGPVVRVYDGKTGVLKADFFAYDPKFMGGVRVAVGDINGDGVPDIITAPGPGGGPDIRVFDGKTFQLIREFFAYHPKFMGGVYVAAGDLNGDGLADIVTGADAGGGPHVQAFSGANNAILASFMAYNPRFLGGVRVAVGDLLGDGNNEIVTGAGPGGGPHVRVFDGTGTPVTGSVSGFYAFDPRFTGGVYVSVGDLTGSGQADIITGAGAGGGPTVRAFSGVTGAGLLGFQVGPNFGTLFFDDSAPFRAGVRVAVVAFAGSTHADIVTSYGPEGTPQVQVFDPTTETAVDSFFAFNQAFPGGVFVGGA